ncbi:MAG: hypothetical protein JKY81_05660 [Colwellia sp.]|nr:hypothetical protein [Colwellia sp.]
MREVKSGDVVLLQMDDELIVVDSVDLEVATFTVLDAHVTPEGISMDFYHEYPISDIMTVYRMVD